MNLTIRKRLYILSIIPILTMAIGMMWFTYLQTTAYNEQEIEQTRSQMMEMKKLSSKTTFNSLTLLLSHCSLKTPH